MTQYSELSRDARQYYESLEGIKTHASTIFELVESTEDEAVEVPTFMTTEYSTQGGESLEVSSVRIDSMGGLDGAARAIAITISEAPKATGTQRSVVGLLMENQSKNTNLASLKFMTTEVIDRPASEKDIPAINEFKVATAQEADNFAEDILYDVAFNLRALVRPWDVPHPEEHVPEAIQSLKEGRLTIPGVAYMGQLLIDPDWDPELFR